MGEGAKEEEEPYVYRLHRHKARRDRLGVASIISEQAGGGAVEIGTRVGEGKNRGQLNFSGHFRRLFQISGGFQEFLH